MRRYATSLEQALRDADPAASVQVYPDAASTSRIVGGRRWTRKLRLYLYWYWIYPRQARAVDADIYHITEHLLAHLVAGVDRRRAVVTCHDLMQFVAPGLFSRSAVPLITALLARWELSWLARAACIVADSETTRRDLLRLTGVSADRVEVIYPGLDPEFRPHPRAWARQALEEVLPPQSVLLLHVGNCEPYKNVPTILRVVRALSRRRNVTLVKVGQQFTDAQLREIDEVGLTDRVLHLGAFPADQLPVLYSACDALLFPSLYEGFGWPAVEAMACGLPVVTSTGGALPEVVGDAAVTADARDVDGLTAAIESVLDRPDLRSSLVERGLARAGLFTWERYAGALSIVYDRVGAPRGPVSRGAEQMT